MGPTDRFAFGENWASYAATITGDRVERAEAGLVRLLGADGLRGRSVLDIGSGSGIHAAAALRLGAASVVAVDLDPASVATTRAASARCRRATWRSTSRRGASSGAAIGTGARALRLIDPSPQWKRLYVFPFQGNTLNGRDHTMPPVMTSAWDCLEVYTDGQQGFANRMPAP